MIFKIINKKNKQYKEISITNTYNERRYSESN
jgi:hypothetical protein